MKVSRKEAQENLERVVETAARLLRENGFEGIGIAYIMKASGLTHGGFYRNFASKDELLVKASARAASNTKRFLKDQLEATPEDRFGAFVKIYVSEQHRDNPGEGCVLPSLSADAARRHDPRLHAVFVDVIRTYLHEIAALAPTMPEAMRSRDPRAILSEMVGAILLSRVTDDEGGGGDDSLIRAVVGDILGQGTDTV